MQDANICVIGSSFIDVSEPAADKIHRGGIHKSILDRCAPRLHI